MKEGVEALWWQLVSRFGVPARRLCPLHCLMLNAMPNSLGLFITVLHVLYGVCMVVSLVRAFPALTHEDLHEVVCEVTTCQVQTKDGVWQGIALVDGHGVGHTITAVQHDTCMTQLQEEV